ncbi:MAG: hypothetical protein KDD42_02895 [Bdellovibrionales bacterium]|nr:hypothetical protein [Bdellovibrionales bacterium]
MRNGIAVVIVAGLLLVLAHFATQESLQSPYLSLKELSSTLQGEHPPTLLEIDTNALIPWLSPGPDESLIPKAVSYFGSTLLIFFSGLIILSARNVFVPLKIVAASLPVIAIVLLFGRDPLLLKSLAWSPWLIWACRGFVITDTSRTLSAILITIFGSLVAVSAQIYALPIALICALYLSSFTENAGRNAFATILMALPIGLFVYNFIPIPTIPDYPPLARVVPDDDLPGILRPLVGPDTIIPIVNRVAMHSLYGFIAALALGLAFLLSMSTLKKDRSIHLLCISLFLLLSAAWDVSAPEFLSQVGPLAAVSRVIPGLFFTPLFKLCFCLGISLYSVSLVMRDEMARIMLFHTFLLGMAMLLPSTRIPLLPGILRDSSALAPITQWDERRSEFSPQQEQRIVKTLASPSFMVLREAGLEAALEKVALEELSLRRLKANIIASHNSIPRRIKHLSDNNLTTRWSAQHGAQNGDEWLLITWQQAITLSGIKLDTGAYKSDFPRGIEISLYNKCSVDPLDDHPNSVPLLSFLQKDWQGPIEHTKAGYPFFGAQSDVTIRFNRKIPDVTCLLVKQIGRNTYFDWSVAEVRLLVESGVKDRLNSRRSLMEEQLG